MLRTQRELSLTFDHDDGILSMPTRPPCPSSPRASAAPVGSGPWCATISPSPERRCPPSSTSSPDRGGQHRHVFLAGYAGVMQADAYSGSGRLYDDGRAPGPIVEAACWTHSRRKFFDIAELSKAPIALEAVEISGLDPKSVSPRAGRRAARSRRTILRLQIAGGAAAGER
jgi:hypothetical protein